MSFIPTRSKRPGLVEQLEPRRMFAAPGLNWPLVFDDEFNGSAVDSTKWTNYLPWSNSISGDNRYHATNNAYASYMEPYDESVSNGMLHLATTQQTVYSTNGTQFNYTEAMLTTTSTFWYEYGYAEVRAELPTGVGNWPAFWALSNGWPPENDIMEAGPGTGINHQGLYDMSSHWQGPSTQTAVPPANTWHTYGLQWGPGYEDFYEDGTLTYATTSYTPSESMYFLLNSGVATASDASYSNANNNTLNVDYCRVYGYNASTGAMIVNGDMNTNGTGFDSSSNNYGNWSMNNVYDRTGYDCLEINGSTYGAAQETVTGLLPNTTYTFSAYGYSSTSGDWGYIGAKNYASSGEVSTQFTQTSWGLDQVTFTTGPTNTSVLLYLYTPQFNSTVNNFYDDASLEVTPTISIASIKNVNASAGASVTLPITINETGGIINTAISASSSNTSVLKSTDLIAGGTDSSPTLTLNLEPGSSGSSTITVTATDPGGVTATQTFVVTSLPSVTINGDLGGTVLNDVFRLVRSGANVALYENNTNSTPTQSYVYTGIGPITVNGLGGSNQLILDYSGGDPIPASGLTYNGGTGTNTLSIQNMPGTESAVLSNGSLVIGSDNIAFANTSALSLDLGSGSSTLSSTTPVLASTLSLAVDAGATLKLAASSTLPVNSIVSVAGTGILQLNNQSESIDQLSGGGTVSTGTASTVLTIGANNGSSSFGGSITGSAGLTKIGTGTFTLAGSDSFTGAVNLGGGATSGGNVDGILQITSTAALAGVTQVNLNDNNTAYCTLQLNSSTGISLPATTAFLLDANSAGAVPGTAATMIDSVAGNNTIAGAMSFTVGGAGYGIAVDSGSLNFTGPQGTTSHVLFLRGAGAGSFTFGLVGTGSIVNAGPGSWTLNGPNSYSGYTNISGGTLNVTASASLASKNINASPGGTLNMLGTLPATAAVTANGSVNFGASTTSTILVRTLASLSIGTAGEVAIAKAGNHLYRTLLQPGSLTFAGPTATLDLNNNDLDAPGATLSTLQTLVATGYNSGQWTGTGITSSAAATDSNHLTALGIISNNLNGSAIYGSGSGAMSTFDGITPGINDVLIKFTYYGDANLDGVVDGSDYSRIDAAYQSTSTGWFNGDFNYDTFINGSDYTLIDNAFNTQSTNLTTTVAVAANLKTTTTTSAKAKLATVTGRAATSSFAFSTSPLISTAFNTVAYSQVDDQDILTDLLRVRGGHHQWNAFA